jgi:hypothetical protein
VQEVRKRTGGMLAEAGRLESEIAEIDNEVVTAGNTLSNELRCVLVQGLRVTPHTVVGSMQVVDGRENRTPTAYSVPRAAD